MVIFNDYELSDALFDLPCIIGNAKIYPTKVTDHKTFQKYSKYILYSKKHFNITDDCKDSLLKTIIYCHIKLLQENPSTFNSDLVYQQNIIVKDIAELLSIVCREKIKFNYDNGKYTFVDKDGLVIIDENNFDTIRKILLKLNMMFEPKIYESEIERKWEEKAMIARNKSNNKEFDFIDIITIVSCSTGKSYKEISEQNVIQLYSDFFRCTNTESSIRTTIFQSVGCELKGTNFTDSIVGLLFRNPYEGIWTDKSSLTGKL